MTPPTAAGLVLGHHVLKRVEFWVNERSLFVFYHPRSAAKGSVYSPHKAVLFVLLANCKTLSPPAFASFCSQLHEMASPRSVKILENNCHRFCVELIRHWSTYDPEDMLIVLAVPHTPLRRPPTEIEEDEFIDEEDETYMGYYPPHRAPPEGRGSDTEEREWGASQPVAGRTQGRAPTGGGPQGSERWFGPRARTTRTRRTTRSWWCPTCHRSTSRRDTAHRGPCPSSCSNHPPAATGQPPGEVVGA